MRLSLLLLLVPLALRAQSERAIFLVRQGVDTLAVETMTHDGSRYEAALRLRTPVVTLGQQVTLDDSGFIRQIATSVSAGARGDSLVQRGVLTIAGDSALSHVEDRRATPAPDHWIKVPVGAVPFVNLSGLSLELMLRRARTVAGDTARIPVLLVGGQSVVATVTRRGADSAVVMLGGVELRAHTDATGRLLGAGVPSQGVVFERLPGTSRIAAWRPAPPVSYAAPPGAPYTAEEVSVHTPAGLTFVGTLTVPKHAAGTRVPAVVLITGSGPQDRDEGSPSLPQWRPFRDIADTLSRRGIAVLRLDDRGVGRSDAGPPTATSADFADDIRAALAWLRTRPDVDPRRLGLVGHSEGAMIAPMVAASDPTLRAMVLLAGTASRGDSILEWQRRYLLSRDTSLTPAKRDSLLRLADAASDSAYRVPGWLHFFASYDPLPTARRVRTPTLILQGENDHQVPVSEARTLAAAMRAAGNTQVTLRTFPQMDHLLVQDPVGNPLAYLELKDFHVRKDLLGVMADWLARELEGR